MCALLALGNACATAYAVVQPGVCFSPPAAVLETPAPLAAGCTLAPL